MKYVIKIEGCEGHNDRPEIGQYVVSYGGAEDAKGYADLVTTSKMAGAMRFDTFMDATEFWRQQSRTVPTRSTDGKPNRPLTMYTVDIIPDKKLPF